MIHCWMINQQLFFNCYWIFQPTLVFFLKWLHLCSNFQLLFKLSRPVEVAARGYAFIISFSKTLALHEVCDILFHSFVQIFICSSAHLYFYTIYPFQCSLVFLQQRFHEWLIDLQSYFENLSGNSCLRSLLFRTIFHFVCVKYG